MKLERQEGIFMIGASLLSELLDVQSSDIQALMRRNEITSLCERGEGEHGGKFRLTFSYKGRRARLNVDEAGTIERRSIVELGERPPPAADHSMERPSASSRAWSSRLPANKASFSATNGTFTRTSDSHVTKDDNNGY
ncbi:DUF6522 family protein [Mesorhizobium sp. WSM4976]|uniref:DUF6522 family protein n=1 Tax=Mesorhizobium sp. WSM4976 TaxID=3038549 RepID=UPI002416269C|nr:DUF6522 family protein [Mesorhizobium sp. WSM4976]MDG4892498.1 DUF6522 family protein [Mesorhizobium sp. WSM4976]